MLYQQDHVNVFRDRFGKSPKVLARAPGRINLIGEHTDYNQGMVLPAAIEQSIVVSAGPGSDQQLRVYSQSFDELVVFPAETDAPATSSRWQNYVRGVVAGLRDMGWKPNGANLYIGGNLPTGEGLSSSAALCVAVTKALFLLANSKLETIEIARLAQQAEHDFAGTPCGLMDPYVSLVGREGHAILIHCGTAAYEYVPLHMQNHALVVINSGVKHNLSSGAYEQRVKECAQASSFLAKQVPTIKTLCDVTPTLLDQYHDQLDPTIARRAIHVVHENQRVLHTVSALRSDNIQALGLHLNESHCSLRDEFEVSCPEIEKLRTKIMQAPGVLGSRMIGGGFGGSILVLIQKPYVKTLQETIGYSESRTSGLVTIQTGPGAQSTAL